MHFAIIKKSVLAVLAEFVKIAIFIAPLPANAGQTTARFDIFDFAIDGNSVLEAAAIEKAVYPHMGPDRTVEDVEAARLALENAYREAGYQTVLVVTPEQEVSNGVVQLQVVEGKLERVQITGTRYFSLQQIGDSVPALAAGTVPNLAEAQRELEAVALQSRDRQVTPVLRAGSAPGLVEAELRVKDELPLHGTLEVNDRDSVDTSSTRVLASLRYDNLWQRFHSVSLQYQTAPEDRAVEVWSATYAMPVSERWNLAAYYAKFDSQSAVASAGALAVLGTGEMAGLRLVGRLQQADLNSQGAHSQSTYVHSVSLGVDRKKFDQSIELLGADDQNTPIDYLPFSVRYDGSWSDADGSFTSFSAGPNFSLRGVGNSQQEFEDKRFLARANYLYLLLDAQRLQMLPRDFRLRAKFSGQLSDSPLISSEQFSVGGVDTVRGYHESEVLGDQGVTAGLELQSPALLARRSPLFEGLRLTLFAEAGRVWIKEALPGTESRDDLSGAGIGLRFSALRSVEGSFDWAWPLASAGSVEAGDARAHFSLSAGF